MKKKVVINASPDLKQAAKRNKREPIVFVRDNLVVPSKLALLAKDKKYYIRTYGCQANVLDGQTIEGILREIGYTPVENEMDADLIEYCLDALNELERKDSVEIKAERTSDSSKDNIITKPFKKVFAVAAAVAILAIGSLSVFAHPLVDIP